MSDINEASPLQTQEQERNESGIVFEEDVPNENVPKSKKKSGCSGWQVAVVCSSVLFWLVAAYSIFVSIQWAKSLQSESTDSYLKTDNFEIIAADPISFKLNGASITGSYDNETGAIQLLGIPYAKRPVENLRFRPPVPHTLWDEENEESFDANSYASPCLSGVEKIGENFGLDSDFSSRSEDCLYMNIWIPSSLLHDQTLKPVLFFIHGGSFIGGNANRRESNGRKLAEEEDVIVISVQYRLGIYGFGYVGRMRDENVGHFEQGNFAIQDVRLALRIIHENIGFLGGDKERITIMGNSAGAIMTGLLLSDEAPVYFRDKSWPFYKGAIMQCTPINLPMRTPEDIIIFNTKISTASKCTTLECFQKLSNDEIGELIQKNTDPILFDLTVMSLVGTPFGPIEDNITAFNVNKNQIQNDVPVAIGINADEPVTFLNFLLKEPLNKHIYEAAIGLLFSDMAESVMRLYPATEDNRDNMAQIEQDAIFDCPSRRLLQSVTTSFKYHFHARGMDSYKHWSYDYEWGSCKDNSCHCTDTIYTFGQYEYDNEFQSTAAKKLQNFVGSFVRNVNQPKLSENEIFPESNKGSVVLHFGYPDNLNATKVENGNNEKCDLWDELKRRADLCGQGDQAKCFINWEKLQQAVTALRQKFMN